MRRALALIVVALGAASAQAAPWSFDLPPGYEEDPGAANGDIEALKAQPGTVDADAQLFMSPDQQVGLVRLMWTTKLGMLSREELIQMDRKATHQSDSVHLSDERKWVGDQLVAESIESVRGKRLHQRRLYSLDGTGVLHVFAVTCMGSMTQLATCEKAQQTMQLKVPNAVRFPARASKPRKSLMELIGSAAVGALTLGLVVWIFQSAKRGGRRRQRSTMRRY